MNLLQQLWVTVRPTFPSLFWAVAIVLILVLIRATLGKRFGAVPGWRLRLQLITLGLSLVGLILVVLVTTEGDLRGQLLGLIGILLSAAIALSSTTLIGNAMAGFMLRGIGGFRPGDFLRVGDHVGRVTEQGLFHTEIQTEDRDLTTLPNLFLVTHPAKVIRSSGTIVSASVSLGYDVPRATVQEALIEAAEACALGEPFVQVRELGDFSVTYRVAGLLLDVRQLITTQSRLRARVLDHLHTRSIEIVSPTFMNTRSIPEDRLFVPAQEDIGSEIEGQDDGPGAAEAIMFDKADHAESVEKLRLTFEDLGKDAASLKKRLGLAPHEEERSRLERRLERVEAQRGRLSEILKDWESKDPID